MTVIEWLFCEAGASADALSNLADGPVTAATLLDAELVDERALSSRLACLLGLTFVELDDVDIDAHLAASVEDLSRRHLALPVRRDTRDTGDVVVVAMVDPSNVFALDDLRTVVGAEVEPVVAAPSDLLAAISKFRRASDGIEDLEDELVDDESLDDLSALRQVVDDKPVVRFVNLLITQAVEERASDIHIEPGENDLVVRFRIDGVLHETMRSAKAIHPGVTSRLKIMAEMDIAERRVPQDGRISVIVNGKPIDLRVSTLPTVYGEKVVMRIFDRDSVLLELDDLGFLPHNFEVFRRSFTRPYGMILVTGPTGSGKSTTLYAALNMINTPEINIVTTEDPVEYRLAGINQVQVNRRAGLTFASALRSILRQDPDVVLIGETRDVETAKIAIEAALTGHLVLTTLHTNDAPSAVTRLTEMGIEPFLVGSAVDCVLAQRLARRLCVSCREPYTPEQQVLIDAGFAPDVAAEITELYRAGGCSRCSNTGYRGRLALHEVMPVTETIERLTVRNASSEEIKRAAVEEGMLTLRQDGLQKVVAGLTTIEEVGRVVI